MSIQLKRGRIPSTVCGLSVIVRVGVSPWKLLTILNFRVPINYVQWYLLILLSWCQRKIFICLIASEFPIAGQSSFPRRKRVFLEQATSPRVHPPILPPTHGHRFNSYVCKIADEIPFKIT